MWGLAQFVIGINYQAETIPFPVLPFVCSDLFNLAMPDAWSVVLGDYDRHIESGHEQRIAIDRIVMHDNYENYQHDVVLMRLARPANTRPEALARKICLPFVATSSGSSLEEYPDPDDIDAFDGSSNQLRKLQLRNNVGVSGGGLANVVGVQKRRRNDKFIKERSIFNRITDDHATNFNHLHLAAADKTSNAHLSSGSIGNSGVKSKVNVSLATFSLQSSMLQWFTADFCTIK